MSIASEITRISGNVADAYTAANAKGATMPVTQKSDNLATTIATIPTGITPTGTKSITANGTHDVTNYATADVQVPTTAPAYYVEIDITNGVLKKGSPNTLDFSSATSIPQHGMSSLFLHDSSVSGSVDLSGVTTVANYGLQSCFAFTDITYIDMSGLVTVDNQVGQYGLESAFRETKLTGFDFSNLVKVTVGYSFQLTFAYITTLVGAFSFPKLEYLYGFTNCFAYCTNITFFGFPKLKIIGRSDASAGMNNMFNGCSQLSGVNMNAVESILGNYSQMNNTFSGCNIQVFRFPMLTSIIVGFGGNTFNNVVTEIHFRIDSQSTIEALANYSTKWGASNATIYFDLVGTLTGADGNTYTRDEYNSVYSDQHGQFQTAVAWKYNDTIYYTPAGAEPVVSDAIYSDAACTQSVTTITAIA